MKIQLLLTHYPSFVDLWANVFRADSRVALDSLRGKHAPHIEDFIYSLSYSLRLLRSGRVVAWYSPKRKEGMIELRLFEF
ncbi:hypothetical protein ACFX2I_040318 [Malus domestica]